MLDWTQPWLLLLLLPLPLLRWLFRHRAVEAVHAVPALFLWRDAQSIADAGPRRGRPDPLWLLRALAAGLGIVALAGPHLLQPAPREIDIYLDDSPRLLTREASGTRLDLLIDALAREIDAASPAALDVVSLADPSRTLSLDLAAPEAWRPALRSWVAPQRRDGHLPVRAQMRARAESWLLSDGADQKVLDWARSMPIARIVQAGDERSNTGLTMLEVSRDYESELDREEATAAPRDEGSTRLIARITIHAAEDRASQRRLEVLQGDETIFDALLDVPASGGIERSLPLAARLDLPVRVRLLPEDALASDDQLAVSLAPLEPDPIRLDPDCAPAVLGALRTHPALRPASAGEEAEFAIVCSRAEPTSAIPTLWLRRDALATPALGSHPSDFDDPPLLFEHEGSPRLVEVRVDLADEAWAREPEYFAYLSELLDRTAGEPLLERTASAHLSEHAIRIMPGDVAAISASPRALPPRRTALAPVLLTAAFLVVLLEALLVRPRSFAAWLPRAAALIVLAVAIWNPPLPWRASPLDAIVLLDDSLSMDRAAADTRWRELAAELRALPSGSRLALLRFGAAAALELEPTPIDEPLARALLANSTPQRRAALDRTETDLAAALLAGMQRIDSTRPARLFILSDGATTRGDADPLVGEIAALGASLAFRRTDPPELPEDAWLEHLEVPGTARVGEALRVEVLASAHAPLEARLVLGANGSVVEERWLDLDATNPTREIFHLPLLASGPYTIEATLDVPGDPRRFDNHLEARVDVEGPPRVVYLPGPERTREQGRSLVPASWRLEPVLPADFEAAASAMPAPDALILDDVPIDAMPDTAWQRLERWVRRDGTNLLVLGGEHSFGAGGYRRSRLEGLLPVISEAPAEESRAAILFLVDTSGSMGQESDARLAVARRVLQAALAAISESDLVGVAAFATDFQPLLPLARYEDVQRALDPESLRAASGGTRLAPALREGMRILAASDSAQRLLVVLTDGLALDESEVRGEAAALERAGIQLIGLAVGRSSDKERLTALLGGGGNRPVIVADEATIAIAARREIARHRAPIRRGEFEVVALDPRFPIAAKRVPAYALTRERAGAHVAARVDGRHPWLAGIDAGHGSVLAFTGVSADSGRDAIVLRCGDWQSFDPRPSVLTRAWMFPTHPPDRPNQRR